VNRIAGHVKHPAKEVEDAKPLLAPDRDRFGGFLIPRTLGVERNRA